MFPPLRDDDDGGRCCCHGFKSFPCYHAGETSLHLAARYSRSDAAKRLLEAGSDPNAQDSTGRTPLHAAVAADAIGVFQV